MTDSEQNIELNVYSESNENISCSSRIQKVLENMQQLYNELPKDALVSRRVENIQSAFTQIHREVSELETMEADNLGIPNRLIQAIVEANCPK